MTVANIEFIGSVVFVVGFAIISVSLGIKVAVGVFLMIIGSFIGLISILQKAVEQVYDIK